MVSIDVEVFIWDVKYWLSNRIKVMIIRWFWMVLVTLHLIRSNQHHCWLFPGIITTIHLLLVIHCDQSIVEIDHSSCLDDAIMSEPFIRRLGSSSVHSSLVSTIVCYSIGLLSHLCIWWWDSFMQTQLWVAREIGTRLAPSVKDVPRLRLGIARRRATESFEIVMVMLSVQGNPI